MIFTFKISTFYNARKRRGYLNSKKWSKDYKQSEIKFLIYVYLYNKDGPVHCSLFTKRKLEFEVSENKKKVKKKGKIPTSFTK